VAADREPEVGGAGCCIEPSLVDVERGHGQVVVVGLSGPRRRCTADVLRDASVATELERLLGRVFAASGASPLGLSDPCNW
jgi:hypothetical protein